MRPLNYISNTNEPSHLTCPYLLIVKFCIKGHTCRVCWSHRQGSTIFYQKYMDQNVLFLFIRKISANFPVIWWMHHYDTVFCCGGKWLSINKEIPTSFHPHGKLFLSWYQTSRLGSWAWLWHISSYANGGKTLAENCGLTLNLDCLVAEMPSKFFHCIQKRAFPSKQPVL